VVRHIAGLDDRVRRFIIAYWDTDVRRDEPSSVARASLREQRIRDAVRRFLLRVLRRDRAVTPEQWGELCNVQVDSMGDVHTDAAEFWDWLFDGEPLPGTGGPTGPVRPPQG